MSNTLTAQASVQVHAPKNRVWDALTKPELVKEYLFGTEMVTDGKVGSPILYRGSWEGKQYEDKGVILESEPGRSFVSTYWSSMRGLPDTPENYNKVGYKLDQVDGTTTVTVVQDNIKSEEERKHSEENWKTVLEGLKKVVERPV